MFSIKKPDITLPADKLNARGLSLKAYGGAPSTLCGGCGHDSVTAAIIQACFELSLAPEQLVKMSGIGCSSKTPAYFLSSAHAFNAVHGRMPAVTAGAYAAHGGLLYLGVSGDGDTGSIGIGQFLHAIRRRLSMLYIIENNGVYGLTKGQFSAFADRNSRSKKGEPNPWEPLEPVQLALQLGASFVARSFSGDKKQLVPLLKAGLQHKGFALIDVLSPCVSFNNHEGSTRSYAHIRSHEEEALHIADFVPKREPIVVDGQETERCRVVLHDGQELILVKSEHAYAPNDRQAAQAFLEECRSRQEIATGLLYLEPYPKDFHDFNGTDDRPLRDLPFEDLCPGAEALAKINAQFQ